MGISAVSREIFILEGVFSDCSFSFSSYILSACFPTPPESKWSYATELQDKHTVFPVMGEQTKEVSQP